MTIVRVPRLLSADEVARLFNVTAAAVMEWADRGYLSYYQGVSGRTFYGPEIAVLADNLDVTLSAIRTLEERHVIAS